MHRPPKSDDDDFDSDGAVIDVDKLSAPKRMLMGDKWNREAVKGEPV